MMLDVWEGRQQMGGKLSFDTLTTKKKLEGSLDMERVINPF
jgi:hypothetical protein